MLKKYKKIIIILGIIIAGLCFFISIKGFLWYQTMTKERALLKANNQAIEEIINSRRIENSEEKIIDPFGEDKMVQILFIGLDTRVGQKNGHCDAIQLISIDNNTETITITAVPRGTYSPLPPGTGILPSDYYVSNACGLGGLEYGIQQIEKILGIKADYLVVVNFSETLGIFRILGLPTTETLQWLRNRHGYTIGEPQRAHNHSTFIKQMMIKFVPIKKTKLETALQYIVYKIIKTDLSFQESQKIIDAVSAMDVANYPEKIQLTMRPLYPVQEIPYDSEHIGEYLDQTLGPIKYLLAKDDYSEISGETVQEKLLSIIEENKNNPEFLSWAYKNNLWLQIEDGNKRLSVQYDLLINYLPSLPTKQERESLIADYILEMENRDEPLWQEKARKLLDGKNGF